MIYIKPWQVIYVEQFDKALKNPWWWAWNFAWIIGAIVLMAALTGCASSPPVVAPEITRQPVYIPTPATLTQPVQVTLLPGVTYGEALGRLNAGLQTCNSQLESIQSLKPPKTP